MDLPELDRFPKRDPPPSEPQPDVGAGLDDRRRCSSGVTGPLDALHGRVGRHPYLHALARVAPSEYGKEVFDGGTDVVRVRLVPAGLR
jgi:hypothetical protein